MPGSASPLQTPPLGQTPPLTALGVLRRMGLSQRQCDHLATRAAALRVGPERVAIAWGLVSEDAFYAEAAQALGIGFVGRPFAIDRSTVSPYAAEAGLARTAQGRLVVAPQGAALARFFKTRPPGCTLTTPQILNESMRRAYCRERAWAAADRLRIVAPVESAQCDGGVSGFVIAAWLLALGAIAFCEPAWSLPITTPLFLLFAWTIGQRVTALAWQREQRRIVPPTPLSPAALPLYSILVPLYREDAVIGRLVQALTAFEYPPEKLEILFVVEEHDDLTRAALKRYRLPPFMRIVICPDGKPRTKPRALNIGLQECSGEYVAIYDAEDRPEPDQLAKAAAQFHASTEDVACLQAELAIEHAEAHFFTRGFALEYAVLFQLILPSFCAFGLPVALGGTSNHFRRAALLALNGWDAWNVTEDADLGLRLAWHGYRVAYLPSRTWEEAPAPFKVWRQQRVRWLKGWMQTSLVHLRSAPSRWRGLGLFRSVAMLHHLVGTPVAALLTPFFAFALLAGWVGDTHGFLHEGMIALGSALAIAGNATLLATLVSARPHLSAQARWQAIIFAPAYLLLVSYCGWLALIELIHHPFRWNKTPHGESATPDSAPALRKRRVARPRRVQFIPSARPVGRAKHQ